MGHVSYEIILYECYYESIEWDNLKTLKKIFYILKINYYYRTNPNSLNQSERIPNFMFFIRISSYGNSLKNFFKISTPE